MPNFARLELKPSPAEFDIERFNTYYLELKLYPIRFKLFSVIIGSRNFDEIEELAENKKQALTEINQCIIEALDIALNTDESNLEEELDLFSQKKFTIDVDKYTSSLILKNKFIK